LPARLVIVYNVRFQNRMPLRSWATTGEPTTPNTKQRAAQPRPGYRCKRPLLAQVLVDIVGLVEFLAGVKSGWLGTHQKSLLRSVSRGNRLLEVSGFNDVSSMGILT
jgi:hypothetical protein